MVVTASRHAADAVLRLIVVAACFMVPAMTPDEGEAQDRQQSSTFRLTADAGKWNGAGLRGLPKGAQLAIEAQSDGETTLHLMDTAGMTAFPSGAGPLLTSGPTDRFEFSLTIPEAGDYFLIVDNRSGSEARTAVIKVTASAPGTMSGSEYIESANRTLSLINEALHRVFVLRDLRMRLDTCGGTRAFADDGDIVVCTEYALLILAAVPEPATGSSVMMLSIFQRLAENLAAEDGRTLDIMEMDELAAALMIVLQYRGHIDAVTDLFSDQGRAERFASLMPDETRYRLDPERAERISAAASSPVALLNRWSGLLIASFQPAILERLLKDSPPWAERAAIESELNTRR